MYSYTKNKLPKNTLEINVLIKWDLIAKKKEESFEKLRKNLQIPGFRKGAVPLQIAKKHISQDKIYQDVIHNLLFEILNEIIKKENLNVISTPKIEFKKAKEKEDWQITITLALKPDVNLGNFKEEIKKLKQEEKKVDIWIPGKEDKKEESNNVYSQKLLSKILEKLLKVCQCEISEVVIEEELNHRLTQLIDDIKKIGLTVESYLKSKNLTADQLKEQIKKEIEDTYKLEYILQTIADKENIVVNDKDLENLINAISDPKEKEIAKKNSYFYSTILRKQKTLDYLLNL